ncbi:F-box domain containing protein [Hordeum vulgare]|nr:F-box domain containing protein [Hordeum vulgare]
MHRKRPSAMRARGSKRPRRTADAAAAASASDASGWASLPADLVGLVGWRVLAGDIRDYVRFRAVCPDSRSSSDCPRGRGVVDPRFYPSRWMMLPEGHGLYPGHGKLRGYVRFFNLSTGVIVRCLLPLFKNHCILDTAIRLLHPFTGDIVDLPPLATLLRLPGANLTLVEMARPYLRSIGATSVSVWADEMGSSLS